MLTTLLSIAIGASFGALSRYAISEYLNPVFSDFQLGTLIANLLGCFIIGLVVGSALDWINENPNVRAMIVIGFLGSFTTFSTFSLEVVQLLQEAKYAMAGVKISAHVIGAIFATILGIMAAQALQHNGSMT